MPEQLKSLILDYVETHAVRMEKLAEQAREECDALKEALKG